MSRPPRVPFDSLLASLRPGGRDFERVCKWMLENAPEYRQQVPTGGCRRCAGTVGQIRQELTQSCPVQPDCPHLP